MKGFSRNLDFNTIWDQIDDNASGLDDSDAESANDPRQFVSVALGLPTENAEAETDVDSEASDLEEEGNPAHIPQRLLVAPTQATTWAQYDSDGFESDDNIPLSNLVRQVQQTDTVTRNKIWKAATPAFKLPNFRPPDGPDAFMFVQKNAKAHTDLFHLFWNDEFINIVVLETNRYANQKGKHAFNVTKKEIYVFLGILLLSGYNRLYSKRAYWNSEPDVHTPLVSNAMRRSRFEDIMRFLHFNDNTLLDGTDKMAKIRPIMAQMNDTSKIFPLGEKLSIDESMIKYYGHHGAKQFIRGKPIRFGYKLWTCSDPSGYILHSEVYCGGCTDIPDRGFGQGGNVVLELLKKVNALPGTKVYFDNLFSSVKLLEELSRREIGATGTLRANRIKKEMHLPDKKKFAKTQRGSYVSRTCGEAEVTMWNDNSVVTILSNADSCTPTTTARRFSRKEKKSVDVVMPNCVMEYNRAMGGVDLSDQFTNTYSTTIRSKKWWWPFFAWALNMSVVQVWLLGRRIHEAEETFPNFKALIEVRRSLALYLLLTYGQVPQRSGRGPSDSTAMLRKS